MERRKALAVASAATILLGSAIVAAAAVSGTSLLGFGGASTHGTGAFAATVENAASKRRVIFRSRDVYDRYVVDTGAGVGLASAGPATVTPGPPATAGTDPATPTSPPATSATVPPAKQPEARRTSPTTTPEASETPPSVPTTVPPASPTASPTTTAPPTPTTLPPGVPHDWPADRPIPPMPPNCRQPQLELNGVWNCQSDD